jgi:type VI secretion system protein ImpL
MKRKTRAWVISPLAMAPFLLGGLLLRRILNLTGGVAVGTVVGFAVLGLIASGVVFWYLRARAKALPEPTAADEEIDSILVQAKRRLAAARRGAKLGKTPVILILGPAGSTKTTSLVRSGLEPELLAGEVYRDDAVVPSRVNVWFAEEHLFIEAGGRLLNEPVAFARLLRHLRPSRVRAMLPGGRQAPRLAMVCYSCDDLIKPGAAEAGAGAAQKLRAQLIEAATQLGIRLPVYVLFTKADKLPYFADYVRSFTRDEASEVLGATLPVAPAGQPGSWAEREAARVGLALERVARSLGLRRLELLPRESEEEVRAGLYEFPRELRKAIPFATQFLVDLCRPSQISVSPFLRGFYFTGVRAVYTEDTAAPSVHASQAPRTSAVEATAVFDPHAVMAHQRTAAPVQGSRKIPEWAFLQRVFGQIVLRDPVTRAITGGGSRLDFARRALAATAATLLLLLSLAFVVSWRNNGRTIDDTAYAARALDGIDVAGTVADADALQRLDSLRLQLQRLRQWQTDGPPLSHRFLLYTGDDVLTRVRPLYFDRFEQLLWATTRGSLVASLEGLPSRPNEASEYGATYNALKAYLITTSHARESTPEFLGPELERQWTRGRSIDSGRLDVAKPQFAFFATELPFGNPYDHAVNGVIVDSTRAFLRAFGDVDQFYQALVTEASKVAQSVRFPAQDPLADPFVVPGAYTREGWVFVQSNLQDVNRLFAREQWVLGDATVPEGDRVTLARELRTRYIADYIRNWQEYLAAGRMGGFAGAQGAAANLQILSGRQSPLLRLLSLAAQHTNVDSLTLGKAFQPVHAVMPPAATDALIVEGANQQYMQGLLGLQVAMNLVATSPAGPAREGAIGNARGAVDQLKVQVQQMAQAFNSEGDAQPVGAAVERLLMAPLRNVEGLLTALPTADANAKGQSFCQRFTPLLGKYPFDPRSSVAALVPELSAMFQPGSSLLWNFYEESLRQLLPPQGDGYGPALDAPLRPTREFETFFNRLATISRAFYSADGAGPEIAFELRPEPTTEISEIRVEFDGQSQVVTPTSRASRTFIWQGVNARSASIEVTVNGVPVTVATAQGPWAVFRVFHQADPNWEPLGPGHYRLRWRLPAQNLVLTAEARFDKQIPVFKPDFFERLQCVSRIVAS